MHGFEEISNQPNDSAPNDNRPWYKLLNRYHWFVLTVAALGWLFDTMDQQLFNLARIPAIRELLTTTPGVNPPQTDVDFYAGIATSIFLIGWASGGLAFGILGDVIGRAKTMLLTILIYSAFTGLSALSTNIWDFSFYRFLTGLGVGGEFAVGVSLVAEVMPTKARPFALGLLQALSAVGNISAALISIVLGHLEESGAIGSSWRIMFVIGTLPALLAILIRRKLKEPERWQATSSSEATKKLGSYSELFGDPRWRRNAVVGLAMAFSGVVGLWGIGFFSIDLNRSIFRKTYEAQFREKEHNKLDHEFVLWTVQDASRLQLLDQKSRPQPNQLLTLEGGKTDPSTIYAAALSLIDQKKPVSSDAILEALDQAKKPQSAEEKSRRQEYLSSEVGEFDAEKMKAHATEIVARAKYINGRLTFWAGVTSVMLNLGAFFGIYGFSYLTHYVGRKIAFAVTFIAAMLSTAMVFGYLQEFSQIFWMIPLMGFCQLALFGGYAIYFPELFPTRLRSTGTSFCYNVGRFVAAAGPSILSLLTSVVFVGYPEPMRYAGVTMCLVFVIGLLALPFAPETKGQELPE